MPSAFGDSGGTGANPPLPALAVPGPSSATSATAVTTRFGLIRDLTIRGHSMNVGETPRRTTRVRLPPDVERPFTVFLNGVEQHEGSDFLVRDGALVFERELAREKVGVGRWTSMVFGIAGSYGKDDSVDVVYERNGRPIVAAKLRFEAD